MFASSADCHASARRPNAYTTRSFGQADDLILLLFWKSAMATKDKNRTSDRNEPEEMTVVILKFRGSGETLQKGFEAVNQAIGTLGGPTATRYLPQQLRPAREVPASRADELNVVASNVTQDEGEGDESTVTPTEGNSRKQNRLPKFDSDLDLTGNGTPWKQYAAQKDASGTDAKYLTASAWLTKHAGLSIFKLPQVFTCFRAMQWETQKDFSQPMRKLKAKSSFFDNPKRNEWKLTGIGLEAAEAIPVPTE